jgi:ribosomal protein S18 acetylase RimI-like enzyme
MARSPRIAYEVVVNSAVSLDKYSSEEYRNAPVRSIKEAVDIDIQLSGDLRPAAVHELLVRDASTDDAAAVAAIGSKAMPAQYEGLVDPAAVDAAISQTYAVAAVAYCIDRCRRARDAEFIVAERSQQAVGFLHFDCFGPEPELHRLYLDEPHRGSGIGTVLMNELHSRLPLAAKYMLLVVAGNDRAVRFYERHGLHVADLVDGITYYRERMGVAFPPDTRPFQLVLMRYPSA